MVGDIDELISPTTTYPNIAEEKFLIKNSQEKNNAEKNKNMKDIFSLEK